eukprot:CAMPEP_0184683710 /NCGR_PEP_ID=MMETSP0312-20130426/12273_1 /TAXON_ID=31354 /ORGANISM="Compsopogon coeruleus, Strain SAG 36.94" /LENGTH=402 /DNA_ID=CAMNT_0027136243 /DNA_START=151 /DNA_END=1359 /DNA_ORIENTATION=+
MTTDLAHVEHSRPETRNMKTRSSNWIYNASLDRTSKLSTCAHSCMQVLRNVCVDERGSPVDVVNSLAQIEQARGRIAVVFNFRAGIVNPQHYLHEAGFPAAFYLANCWNDQHAKLYVPEPPYCDSGEQFYLKMANWSTGGRVIANQRCGESIHHRKVPEQENECFEQVKVILNPLRTRCWRDPYSYQNSTARSHRKYEGQPGLGRTFLVEDNNSVVPVDDVAVKRGMKLIRKFLDKSLGVPTKTMDPIKQQSPEKLKIVIVNRIGDAKSRKSRNDRELVAAIRSEFPRVPTPKVYRHLSALTQRDQLRLFHSADIIVAVHGAAFANMIAMRPNSLLVSHCHHNNCNLWDVPQARALQIKYESISYQHLGRDWSPEFVDFNVEEVVKILRRHINEHHTSSVAS